VHEQILAKNDMLFMNLPAILTQNVKNAGNTISYLFHISTRLCQCLTVKS